MKARVILLVLLLALLLAACGRDEAEPAGGELSAPPGSGSAVQHLLPSLSLEESQAMARFLNANRVLLAEDRLFCYDFDEDWSPVLASYRWEDGALSDYTVLARGCVPEYLCRADGWLYYIERSSGAVERVPEQGGDRQLVRAGPCRWLSLRDGILYFCDQTGRFLSLDPARHQETLLLEGPCGVAWPLDGAILYRSERDGGRLYLHRLADGSDLALSAEAAGSPLLWEDRLWYCGGGALHSLDLDGQDPRVYALPETDGALELLPEEQGLSLRGIRELNSPVQWVGGPEGPFLQQARGYQSCDWLGGGLRVDTVYEPDGRIRCYLLQDEKGSHLSFLAGRTT